MTPLVSIEQFLSRIRPGEPFIPLNDDGEPDAARLEIALSGATGIIVAHLPWLLDKETDEVALPVNPQFATALDAICTDIACDRMSDIPTGSENSALQIQREHRAFGKNRLRISGRTFRPWHS